MTVKAIVQTRAKEACSVCRSRKKKCDGVRPKCGTCVDSKLCRWDNVTRKRGPAIGFKPALASNKQLMQFVKSLLEAIPIDQWPRLEKKVNSIEDFPSDPSMVDLWYYGKLSLLEPSGYQREVSVDSSATCSKTIDQCNLQLLCDASTAVIKREFESLSESNFKGKIEDNHK